ncbi:E3 ubiquitin/ISG15 ligase TRIM25-like [Lampris incognitus]|uniref:E3 ubiquitin/ISG15 ligase TRIM25-like n=1 Tax=Lampris incognitus TaxID=2546036 RepID=UPI0024B5E315|nr:E3 ubiquitin/ISG15 ligase TRIM25-like [Lampris incognitus]
MSFSKPQQVLAHELSCPICLQLFSNPVVLPCGHNYCLACIRQVSDTAGGTDGTLPRCPECREEYGGMEALQKNFKLCSIIEGYKASAPPLDGHPQMGKSVEVACDQCIEGHTPAVKTCLRCEVSLCARHLQRHNERESFRSHSIIEPQRELGLRGCTTHGRPLEYFCSSDMTLLCATCFIEGFHQKHDVLTFDVAEEEMRRALESRCKVVSRRLQLTENLLQKAAEEKGASEAVGDRLVNKAVTVMDSMATLVDKYKGRLSVLLGDEKAQRRQSWQNGLTALEEQHQRLMEAQQSVSQTLTETDKHIFIHRFLLIEPQLRDIITGAIHSKIPSKSPLNTKQLQVGLRTQDFRYEMTRLLETLHILLNPLELTFSLCTVHPSLTLSNDLRTVKYSPSKQSYGEHPERFTSAPQVLCSQGFSTGEHVWVVEVGEQSMWSLGLCYKSIPRRGDHSRLGHNTVSWRLQWKNKKLTACHASSNVALGNTTNQPVKVELALDYEGGTLMFHSTKGHREHLHTFRAVFREPVYPAFSIHSTTPESWITLQSDV